MKAPFRTRTIILITLENFGAGEGIRTLDPDLGKVVLYQLSYSRPGIRQAVGACGTRIVGTAARVSSHAVTLQQRPRCT